jgi:colanic acid/amylovoran biosynthesis glycosyltransferase
MSIKGFHPNNMHILHLVNTFLPVTENWIYNQITFNTRCHSSVLCQYRCNESQFPHGSVYPIHRTYTRFARLDLLFARMRERYRRAPVRRIIREVNPDIIHGHFAFESWRHFAAVRQSGLPLVTTFYGLDISMLPRRAIWRRRCPKLFDYGAAFIVEGDIMAARLAMLGCPDRKIHCIPIGVDIEQLRTLPARQNERITRILFTGLGREKKGARYAAEAFIAVAARCPGVELHLIGDGEFRKPVEQRLRNAGIIDKCTFHGIVTVARYHELLAASDLVLVPSVTAANGDDEGGAPVTAIEAQAAGKPVVGTLHCDIPMVVKNTETGLLSPERDSLVLAANLEKLVTDNPLRLRMGAAATDHAARQHNIKNQVEKICEVYRLCLKNIKEH